MKRFILLAMAVIMVFTFVGCNADTNPNGGNSEEVSVKPEENVEERAKKLTTIKDMTGREVTLELPVETYGVSTMDVIDFIIPLKGEDAFHMLVATGNSGGKKAYDDIYYPMFPDLKDRVGIISEHNAPFDLEMILAKKPDVIIVNSAMQAHKHALDVEAKLKEANIPLVLIDVPQNLDTSVQEALTLMGQIFGEEEKAKEVSDFITVQFDLIKNKNLNEKENKPTVYYEKSGTSETFGPTSLSTSSGWGALVSYAGGINIADIALGGEEQGAGGKKGGGSTVLDPEYIITTDPEYIFMSGVSSIGMGADPSLKDTIEFDILNRTGWKNLKAVQNKNVYEFHHELSRTIYSFYPTLSFAKILHPEEFKDVNPDEILEEFYDRYMLIDSTQGVWQLQMR